MIIDARIVRYLFRQSIAQLAPPANTGTIYGTIRPTCLFRASYLVPRRCTFVDYGAGLGLAILVFFIWGFSHSLGVEKRKDPSCESNSTFEILKDRISQNFDYKFPQDVTFKGGIDACDILCLPSFLKENFELDIDPMDIFVYLCWQGWRLEDKRRVLTNLSNSGVGWFLTVENASGKTGWIDLVKKNYASIHTQGVTLSVSGGLLRSTLWCKKGSMV